MGRARIGSLLLFSTIAFASLVGILVERAQAEGPPALAWEARFNLPYSEDLPRAVVTDGEGNIYVTGAGQGPLGSRDFVTVKYDPNGTEMWKASYGSFTYEFECSPLFPLISDTPVDIGLDGAGNVYVTGTSEYSLHCGEHYETRIRGLVVVKYDPAGYQLWVRGTMLTRCLTVQRPPWRLMRPATSM